MSENSTLIDVDPPLTVTCRLAQNILTCTSTNRVILQFCSINGGSAVNCNQSFDVSSLGLAPGVYNLTVFITDVFGQDLDIDLVLAIPVPGIYTQGMFSQPVL